MSFGKKLMAGGIAALATASVAAASIISGDDFKKLFNRATNGAGPQDKIVYQRNNRKATITVNRAAFNKAVTCDFYDGSRRLGSYSSFSIPSNSVNEAIEIAERFVDTGVTQKPQGLQA